MALSVQAIRFNHDPASATVDALNIRRDATTAVTVPEWQNGISVNYDDSPAAYAIAQTAGHTITIQARFHYDVTFAPPGPIEIRAVSLLKKWPWPWPFPLNTNPLGSVLPTQVVFDVKGNSGWVTMNVSGHPSSVTVRNISWIWQWRPNALSPWQSFATTKHRIYVLLDLPTAPWVQTPFIAGNVQLPWTDVLDHVCGWAGGSTTSDNAAGFVTEHVFGLGPGTVTYDCPGGGGSHYTIGNTFNCTAFLDRLAGGLGNGQFVNCTDCGTFVSVFSNALGCDLWSSRMGWGFHLNPAQGIGAAGCGLICGSWTSFSYHEVAWKNACLETDNVFDACLKVNGGVDASTCVGWVPVLPKNMPFGAVGAGQYRDRLSGTGAANCNPQPGTRVRRTVF